MGNLEHYHVPKYQREYTWGRNEWEQLLNDIEENDIGYFMGSIICISDSDEIGPGESVIYELIDGQQRLTTISLMLMAIYRKLLELKNHIHEDDDEEEKYRLLLSNIKIQLICRKSQVNPTERGFFIDPDSKSKYVFLRVQPSTQSYNLDDYKFILSELGIIKGNYKTNYCTVRRLYRAYEYICNNLPPDYEMIKSLHHKINSLKFIHISVTSSSDAFVLFESLNNRGVPLSAMDIIKNKMLANLEKQEKMDIDLAYDKWQSLLGYLSDYNDQERFLRQYYNAFKIYPEIKIEKITKATRSNLMAIYEYYIKKDANLIMETLLEKAEIYNVFVEPDSNGLSDERKSYLLDLRRIGSAPSYLYLLYLFSLQENCFSNRAKTINDTLKFFIKYYLRRNITDYPNTRDLDAINMEATEKCDWYISEGNLLNSTFIIDIFRRLEDNLFSYNSGMARFVLTKLDEIYHSREYKPDLWARNAKGLLVWTVEHILPQGENITQDWIKMIAAGNKDKAKEIHQKWVHCLGNLTLSGYNSKLSNAKFEDKQSLHENKSFLGHKINIGYRNGLSLNNFPFEYNNTITNLAEIKEWTEDSIKARNTAMVDQLIEMYAFDEQELHELEKGI